MSTLNYIGIFRICDVQHDSILFLKSDVTLLA